MNRRAPNPAALTALAAVAGLALAALVFAPLPARALEVGVASADITPDVKAFRVPMAGYGARLGRPSTGVHDPIRAKVLFFKDGDVRMALVTTDLRSVTPQMKRQILDKAAGAGLTADTLLLCASHNHSGPSVFPEKFWQMQFGKSDPKMVETMTDAIAGAVRGAADATVPARLAFAEAEVEGFSHNRRWEYDQAAREAAGEKPVLSARLWVMRVDRIETKAGVAGAGPTSASGAQPAQPMAVLVNFATHPTILGAENMLISAEWPGALQDALEREFPGAVALYTNGAEGDQAPGPSQGADGFERGRDFGTRLAAEAARLVRSASAEPGGPVASGAAASGGASSPGEGSASGPSAPVIAAARIAPALPEIVFSPGATAGPNQSMAAPALEALPRAAEIQALRLGPSLLVAIPGEPIGQVGLDVRRKIRDAGGPDPVVVSLANDYIGYIVTATEYAHGGYEVDSRSFYGPGLGDFISDAARDCAAIASKH